MEQNISISVKKEITSKLLGWVLLSVDPLLFIVHLTVVYIVFLKADDLVLAVITSSFSGIIQSSVFAEQLLIGIKLFSAIAVAIGYGLQTAYQLFLEGKHIVSVFKKTAKKPIIDEEDNAEN